MAQNLETPALDLIPPPPGEMTATSNSAMAYNLRFKFPFYNIYKQKLMIQKIDYFLIVYHNQLKYSATIEEKILVTAGKTVELEVDVVVGRAPISGPEIHIVNLPPQTYDITITLSVVGNLGLGHMKIPLHFEGQIGDLPSI